MHERSLSQAVDTALRHSGGRRVSRVDLKVGALRQVVPTSLEFYFEIAARQTQCERGAPRPGTCAGARPLPGVRTERELGAAPVFLCERCGAACDVVAGDELTVESIEVEEGAA